MVDNKVIQTENLFKKESVKIKPKKEVNVVNVEGSGVYVYKKGFSGKMANTEKYATGGEIKKLAKEKAMASKQVGQLRANKKKLTQKLRTDRLAKKELRVKEYQDRLKRLRTADRKQASLQKKLSQALKFRSKQDMKQSEVQQMYSQGYSGQNDGNLLHARNMFKPLGMGHQYKGSDKTILQAENIILKKQDKRWL